MPSDWENQWSDATRVWLSQRSRGGNWIAIAPTDEIPIEIDSWNRTILHLFQIAFTPEIERRLASSQLADNFQLFAAQAIYPEEGPNIIRLNEEVRGITLVKLNRPVQKGDPVFATDLNNLVSFDLEEEELNSGHFTMFWNGTGWTVSFDFRSGRAKSTQMIEAARQFLATARYSALSGHGRPSIDTLFSACELLSKAHLILHRSKAASAKTHSSIGSAINAWGRLGNIDKDFVTLFNRIAQSRAAARYDAAAAVTTPSEGDFEIVERELDVLEQRVTPRNENNARLGETTKPSGE